MGRILPVSISLCILSVGLVSTSGCQQTANPKIASTGLALALELRVDNEAVGEHYAELKEQISLEKGKLKFKELRGDEVETKTWCFMKYVVGESRWGIVPGTARDCTDDDDDDAKKRAKKRAKRWLNESTEADEVRAEIDYLLTDGWYERALKAVSMSAVTGFDFRACVDDAIGVSQDLTRRLHEGRCDALMDNEEIAVVDLLGERGLRKLGIDLEGVDDVDEEKAMKKYLGKLGELTGADGAAFLMLTNDGWGGACMTQTALQDDEVARSSMLGQAVELCAEVAEQMSKGR